MEKLSQQDMEVLAAVPGVLQQLCGERDEALAKVAMMERRQAAEKVASAMHDKGIEADIPLDTLIDRMEKAAERGELGEIERAVDMVGPDMGTKIASLANDDHRISGGGSDLERFIVGGVGLAASAQVTTEREKESTP